MTDPASRYRHVRRLPGAPVRVEAEFYPAFARAPSEVVRFREATVFPEEVDYLIEWATGERKWVVSWAVHDPAWLPATGAGCTCSTPDARSQWRIPQT